MEKIEPGKYVELGYDLYEVTPEGDKLVHQTDVNDPEKSFLVSLAVLSFPSKKLLRVWKLEEHLTSS